MPTGRPPLWPTPEDLNSDIDRYIEDVKIRGVAPHKTGFAAFLNCSKQSVYEYLERKGPEFSYAIKRLETMSESLMSDLLMMGKGFNGQKIDTTGAIFVAKNMLTHGYKDKTETEVNAKVETSTRDDKLDKLKETEEGRQILEKLSDYFDEQED